MRSATSPNPGNPSQTSVRALAHAEIGIEGMDCMMCAAGLQNKLRARLVEAIEGDGFKVVARDASPQAAAPPAAH